MRSGIISSQYSLNEEWSRADPYWNNVTRLLNWDNATRTLISGSTYSLAGGEVKYGYSPSCFAPIVLSNTPTFDGQTGQHLSSSGTSDRWVVVYGDQTHYSFNGPFTIEFWYRRLDSNMASGISTANNEYGLICNRAGSDTDHGWALLAHNVNAFMFRSNLGTGSSLTSYTYTMSGAINSLNAWFPQNVWVHTAVTRASDNYLRFYRNGVFMHKSSTTHSGTTKANGGGMTLYRYGQNGGSRATNALWDEVRITKGVARYSDDINYTILTKKFPTVGY